MSVVTGKPGVKQTPRKLMITRERLRALGTASLSAVAGGTMYEATQGMPCLTGPTGCGVCTFPTDPITMDPITTDVTVECAFAPTQVTYGCC